MSKADRIIDILNLKKLRPTSEKIFFLTSLIYIGLKLPLYTYSKYIDIILGITLIAFLLQNHNLKKSFPVYMFIVTILYTLLAWVIGNNYIGEPYSQKLSMHQLSRLYISVALAFYIMKNDFRANMAIIAFSVGLLITPFTLGNGFSEIAEGLNGRRIDFNIQNAQHTSMLFGTLIIATIIFTPSLIRRKKLTLAAICIMVFCVSALVLKLSQTRTIQIALIICILFIGLACTAAQKNQASKLTMIMGASLLCVFIIITGKHDRLYNEFNKILDMWDGNILSLASTSIGARINSWAAGLEWIVQSPWIGWGSRGGFVVAENTPWLKGTISSTFGHMHSSYIEVLVRYGLLGALLIGIFIFWIAVNLRSAYKNKVIPKETYLFLCTMFLYLAIVNSTESYLFYWTGIHLKITLTSIAISYIWRNQEQIQKDLKHES